MATYLVASRVILSFIELVSYTSYTNLMRLPEKFSQNWLSPNKLWRPVGLCDVRDPTLSGQSAYRLSGQCGIPNIT
jgi:hypothetical protein